MMEKIGRKLERRREIEIPPKTTVKTVFRIPNGHGTATISIPNDTLTFDDSISALPEARTPLRVALEISNRELRELVERVFKLQNVVLTKPSNSELIAADRPAAKFAAIPRLLFPRSGKNTSRVAGPYTIDHSHPLVNGLNLKNTIWTSRPDWTPLRGLPLVFAGETPLVSLDADREAPLVMMNFIPKGSTLQNTANWPILFCNIVDWARGKRPGLKRENFKCGEKVVFTPPKGVERVFLTDPYGGERSFAVTSGELLLPSNHPGEYTISAGGRKFGYITRSVNPVESDLSSLGHGVYENGRAGNALGEERRDLTWVAIAAALILLFIHGWMIAKRKRRVDTAGREVRGSREKS
jgi:hypothetical protein